MTICSCFSIMRPRDVLGCDINGGSIIDRVLLPPRAVHALHAYKTVQNNELRRLTTNNILYLRMKTVCDRPSLRIIDFRDRAHVRMLKYAPLCLVNATGFI